MIECRQPWLRSRDLEGHCGLEVVAVGVREEQMIQPLKGRLAGLYQGQRPLRRIRISPGIPDQAVDENGF